MTYAQSTLQRANPYFLAGAGALAVLLMTSIHHVYGTVIYNTPFRLHIVYVAVPVGIAIVVVLVLASAWRGTAAGRAARWIAVGAILFFPVAMIGVYEGGYNHVVKNFLYFVLGEDVARAMCADDGVCELPDSFIFELTGIAQFFLAIPAAIFAWRLVGERDQ